MYPFVASLDGVLMHDVSKTDVLITNTSVLKIDFCIGHRESGEHSFIGRTLSRNNDDESILKFLDKLKSNVIKKVKKGLFETNDELSLYMQKKCVENDCEFVENCKSYMYTDNLLFSDDSKYIMCNYKKYYNDDDILMEYNDCFDFESGETYNIDISIVKSSDNQPSYKILEAGLGFFNNEVYHLKMKSSRMFFSKAKTLKGNNVFFLGDYTSGADKLGKRECEEHGILEYLYPIKCNQNVYSIRFTVTFK
jgi:hypothetical protein